MTDSSNFVSGTELRSIRARATKPRRACDGASLEESEKIAVWIFEIANRQRGQGANDCACLSPIEYLLLLCLTLNSRQVVSRDRLTEISSSRSLEPYGVGIDDQIGSLRQKIESDLTLPSLIRKASNVGYMFVPGHDW